MPHPSFAAGEAAVIHLLGQVDEAEAAAADGLLKDSSDGGGGVLSEDRAGQEKAIPVHDLVPITRTDINYGLPDGDGGDGVRLCPDRDGRVSSWRARQYVYGRSGVRFVFRIRSE